MICIAVTFLCFSAYSEDKLFFKSKIPNKINKENLVLFFNGLRKICKTSSFELISKHSSYSRFGSVKDWEKICKKISTQKNSSFHFLKKNFILLKNTQDHSLLTGYYEPEILISTKKNKIFRYPILKKSNELMIERKKILESFNQTDVLYWTDSDINLFFLQIQGSGLGILRDGKKIRLRYSANNGFSYTSIGKVLTQLGEIEENKVSLQSLKLWLKKNPKKREGIFNKNKRYIFFEDDKNSEEYSVGAMGLSLIPNVSIAIDKSIYPFGLPFLLLTEDYKDNKLVISHDTGSAIKGVNRADLFMGRGREAEEIAGNLKKKLQLSILVPYNQFDD